MLRAENVLVRLVVKALLSLAWHINGSSRFFFTVQYNGDGIASIATCCMRHEPYSGVHIIDLISDVDERRDVVCRSLHVTSPPPLGQL